ncbi:MAG: ABC transporter ATP-binding protein [Roseovarius sp.]|jgi:spermidine/putrescine ABC transporter ATP-binding subunit|nr:ABC transporter ATP-binding protein [Roseovarius sp.]
MAARETHGVRFEQICKSFGEIKALRPLNLEIKPGEFLTLLGPSGSGKTTLLNIVAGFLDPDGGRLILGGQDVTALPPRARNIGMVFQNYALFPHMSVAENVAYGLKVRSVKGMELRRQVTEALEMVQLDGYSERAIDQLSGGQQQRVALARAMVIEPDLLLMDEPLGALDRQLRKHVQLEIRRLHTKSPRTTIYVTHDQEEALVMSDRVAIMRNGRIVQIGTPGELYDKPDSAYIARFLGESNLLPVKVLGAEKDSIAYSIRGYEGRFSAPAKGQAETTPGEAQLLIRPEVLRVSQTDDNSLRVVVEEVVYLGELTATKLRFADGQEGWLRAMKSPAHQPGDVIRVTWAPEDSRLLPAKDEAAN